MVTMKQVAAAADVSIATVSRVINKTGYVSPDLEARVVEAMQRLHYQPSSLARSLRRQETQTIGVLIPQLDHPFFGTLAFAIEKALFANEYRAFICSAEENEQKERAYIQMLLRQHVDGVIIVPTGHSSTALELLQERGVAIVLVDRDVPTVTDVSKVLVDNYHGGHMGMSHLLDLGHRIIGIIGAPDTSEAMADRVRGLQQALSERALDLAPDYVIRGALQQFELGYSAALSLLSKKPRPTAIFALTDVMAVGVMHAAAQLRLRLPDDLSVIGFDDIPLAAYSIPSLTTVAQPIAQMGQVAVELMLDQLVGSEAGVETRRLNTKLIVRGSTAAPRQD